MTYQLTTLPNGLRVASEHLPGAQSVAVVLHARVGARYESASQNGISHLLEHMAFKGTQKRNAKQIAESFDNVGGQINAYTSMEHTVYYARVLPDHTELAVDMLCDIIQNSVFDEKELAREKDVILQEIAMNRDSPEDMIVDYFDAVAFPGQPMGASILGSEENVSGFSRADVDGYMRSHYTPDNLVLSAAGAVKHEDIVALAEQYFTASKQDTPPPCPEAQYHGGDSRVGKDLEQLHLAIGLPAITILDDRYYAFQIYANILGGGMSSRLFQEVREKRGLAYHVDASSNAYADCGILSVYAGAAPERGGELSGVLCEQVAGMAKHITDAELARAKNQLKAALLMTRESPQSVAMWVSRHLQVFGDYRKADELTRRIDAVTKDDITQLGAQLLKGKPSVAAYGPVDSILPYGTLGEKLVA